MTVKTYIKKRNNLASLLNNKKTSKHKNRKNLFKKHQKSHQTGGKDEPKQNQEENNEAMLAAESEEMPENFNRNLQEMNEEEQPYQNQSVGIDETGERQESEHALVGAYNKPTKGKNDLQLNKAIQESRGGLFLDYPGAMNMNKETALKYKTRNKKLPGFTDYKGENTDELEPKFLANNFYPKDSVYYEIMTNSGKQIPNNQNNMNQNNMNNELNNNELNNNQQYQEYQEKQSQV
jgi:hypothetical protein